MYKERPNIFPPKDESQTIWRYMDFTKFISLLDGQSLFFTRLDLFEDSQEGVSPKSEIDFLAQLHIQRNDSNYESHRKMVEESELWQRKCIGINCWHMNDYESIAMWKVYLKTNEGIAIKSSYKKLKDSFHIHKDDEIAIGTVQYVDYDNYKWENKLWFNVTHKRIFFEYEKELRAFVLRYPENMGRNQMTTSELFRTSGFEGGINVKVDLDILIDEIVVAPNAPSWFFHLVKSITHKYNKDIKIVESKVNR